MVGIDLVYRDSWIWNGSTALAALATFHIRNRARKYRGPMDALDADWSVWPLASVQAVRAGCATGGEDRQDEIVNFELMRRCDPELTAAGHRREEDERLAFVREVIDDDTNPVWDLLDRAVAIDAAENYATLKVKQRRRLFVSATTALWARMET